jgi:glutaredoxin
MNFIQPSKDTFTIYTKSGCPNCVKAKKLLTEFNMTPLIIDCDDYLIEYRAEFLTTIKNLANIDLDKVIFFPIIFEKGKYIGGFKEMEKILLDLLFA